VTISILKCYGERQIEFDSSRKKVDGYRNVLNDLQFQGYSVIISINILNTGINIKFIG